MLSEWIIDYVRLRDAILVSKPQHISLVDDIITKRRADIIIQRGPKFGGLAQMFSYAFGSVEDGYTDFTIAMNANYSASFIDVNMFNRPVDLIVERLEQTTFLNIATRVSKIFLLSRLFPQDVDLTITDGLTETEILKNLAYFVPERFKQFEVNNISKPCYAFYEIIDGYGKTWCTQNSQPFQTTQNVNGAVIGFNAVQTGKEHGVIRSTEDRSILGLSFNKKDHKSDWIGVKASYEVQNIEITPDQTHGPYQFIGYSNIKFRADGDELGGATALNHDGALLQFTAIFQRNLSKSERIRPMGEAEIKTSRYVTNDVNFGNYPFNPINTAAIVGSIEYPVTGIAMQYGQYQQNNTMKLKFTYMLDGVPLLDIK